MLDPLPRFLFRIVSRAAGHKPGPILLASYRKDFFGNPFAPCLDQAMRGARHWTVGEVELFAAFVSRLNTCGY